MKCIVVLAKFSSSGRAQCRAERCYSDEIINSWNNIWRCDVEDKQEDGLLWAKWVIAGIKHKKKYRRRFNYSLFAENECYMITEANLEFQDQLSRTGPIPSLLLNGCSFKMNIESTLPRIPHCLLLNSKELGPDQLNSAEKGQNCTRVLTKSDDDDEEGNLRWEKTYQKWIQLLTSSKRLLSSALNILSNPTVLYALVETTRWKWNEWMEMRSSGEINEMVLWGW